MGLTSKSSPARNLVSAREPARLDQAKPGDKVRFMADKVQASITITEMELVTERARPPR